MAALTFTRYSSTGYGTSWQTHTQVRLHTMLSLKESEVPVTLSATEANAKTPICGKKTNTRRGDRKQASSQTGARRSDVNGLLTVENWSIDTYIQGSTDGQSSRMRRAKSSTQTVRNGTERWSGALITSMICWQWRQSTWAPRTDPCRHVRWSLSRSRAYMQRGRRGDTDRHTQKEETEREAPLEWHALRWHPDQAVAQTPSINHSLYSSQCAIRAAVTHGKWVQFAAGAAATAAAAATRYG